MVSVYTSVEPGHRYISYSNVSFVTTTNSYEVSLLHVDNVNDSDVLKSHTLQNDKVLLGKIVLKDFNWLSQFFDFLLAQAFREDGAIGEYLAGESLLAQLALHGLPAVGLDVLALLLGALLLQPLSQAE